MLNYNETHVFNFKIVFRLENNKRHVKPYELHNVVCRQHNRLHFSNITIRISTLIVQLRYSAIHYRVRNYSITIFVTIQRVQTFACLQIRFSYLQRILIMIMKLSTLTRVYIGFSKLSSGHK